MDNLKLDFDSFLGLCKMDSLIWCPPDINLQRIIRFQLKFETQVKSKAAKHLPSKKNLQVQGVLSLIPVLHMLSENKKEETPTHFMKCV